MKNYKGWTIRAGFLGGNLDNGDGLPDGAVEAYAEALEEALQAHYPGAEIEIPYQKNASGCLPIPLQIAAWNRKGQEMDCEIDNIERIVESVYSDYDKWLI